MNSLDLPPPRGDWALFLDFDGTLVEIAESPDAVRAGNHLVDTLLGVAYRLGGAVAVISGRPVSDLDLHLGAGRFAAAGLHGLEIRASPGAEVVRTSDEPIDPAVRAGLDEFARHHPGVLVEDKGPTVALHFRARPDLAEAAGAVAGVASRAVRGLKLLEGKMVFEIKPADGDKGAAVRRLMKEPPFAGRVPVFVGDDVTDEDGFRAAGELGGFGIKVGAGPTAAAYRIDSVAAFLEWLASMPDRLVDSAGEVAGR